LARCEWIERRENVIALGPSGTGKTHVAIGLGLAACQKGLSVGFTTVLLQRLIGSVKRASLQPFKQQEFRTARPGTDSDCRRISPVACASCGPSRCRTG